MPKRIYFLYLLLTFGSVRIVIDKQFVAVKREHGAHILVDDHKSEAWNCAKSLFVSTRICAGRAGMNRPDGKSPAFKADLHEPAFTRDGIFIGRSPSSISIIFRMLDLFVVQASSCVIWLLSAEKRHRRLRVIPSKFCRQTHTLESMSWASASGRTHLVQVRIFLPTPAIFISSQQELHTT